jgi:hypothetical protein
VTRTFRYRIAVLVVVTAIGWGSLQTKAPAALDMYVGIRKAVTGQPLSACNSAAKTALTSVLLAAGELGSGTGEWEAYGTPDTANGSTQSAAIHCYPLGSGYLVTFTCAVQVPPSPDSASALCAKLATAFGVGDQ